MLLNPVMRRMFYWDIARLRSFSHFASKYLTLVKFERKFCKDL